MHNIVGPLGNLFRHRTSPFIFFQIEDVNISLKSITESGINWLELIFFLIIIFPNFVGEKRVFIVLPVQETDADAY